MNNNENKSSEELYNTAEEGDEVNIASDDEPDYGSEDLNDAASDESYDDLDLSGDTVDAVITESDERKCDKSGFKSSESRALKRKHASFGHTKDKKTWKQRTVTERLAALIPSFLIVLIIVTAAIQNDFSEGFPVTFRWSVVIAVLSIAAGGICIRLGRVFGWILTAFAPAASFFLTEFFTHNPFEMERRLIIVNLLLYYLVAIIVLFLTGSQKASVAVSAGLPMLFGITNYYVLEFRGSPFFPWDISSAGIAADVVDNYQFIVTWSVCIIVCAFLFILQLGFLCTPHISLKLWWLRAPASIISLTALIMLASFIQTDGVKKLSMYPHLFSPKQVYKVNGAGVTFVYTLQFSGIDKPAGYSADKVSDMLDKYECETINDDTALPNVIVIMNEAFSDLKTAVDYKTNMPVTPNIDSLNENSVKGTLHVSVKGGNTANSEFEFLTGISMANMTPGSIPYQQNIKGETPTFVKQLSELGYKTVGMHPYGATGWKRNQVYDWFGFDETYFSPDFNGCEKIRNYYSDAATYDKIINLYENKDEGVPLFVFDVTMQNHGGYSTSYENFSPRAFAAGITSNNSVNTYLSLINKSDESFGKLVDYFKAQDEPTVILMFGDHQPHDSYVRTLLKYYDVNIETGSLDEQLRRYTVPFVMWANYDIEEENGVDTSVNYLSSMLCEKAGIPRTSVQMYLSALSEEYPVVTEGHFGTADGEYYSAADIDEIDVFRDYKMLSYNMIVDRKNTIDTIYSYR